MNDSITVRFEKMHPDAKIPTKGTELRTYYDIASIEDVELTPEKVFMVHTGLKLQPLPGYFIDVRPRSGLAKEGITLNNSPGVIDCDYGGELICELIWHTELQNYSDWTNRHDFEDITRNVPTYKIKKCDRIAQINVMPMYNINFIETKIEGTSGFGSTGK